MDRIFLKEAGFDTEDSVVTELVNYIINDGDLYRQRTTPIIDNLKRKIKKGIYDPEKAVKLFMYLADDGAKKYSDEFGMTWHNAFPTNIREKVARELLEYYQEEINYVEKEANLNKQARVYENAPEPFATPKQIAESFVNGNISWVRVQVDRDVKRYTQVLKILQEIAPDYVESYMRLMTQRQAFLNKQADEEYNILDKLNEEDKEYYDIIVDDYVEEMEWNEGMMTHPSDYFTDTSYVIAETFPKLSEEERRELQDIMEKEIVNRLNQHKKESSLNKQALKYPEIKVGTIIKISGDYDEEQEAAGLSSLSEYHNTWATIVAMEKISDSDNYILDVVLEGDDKILKIVDESVKWPIGDLENDYVGIGAERHKNEIVPEIIRVMKKFKISGNLSKNAIGEQLQNIAEEIINKTYRDVQSAIDSGIEEETAITEITNNYIAENYGDDKDFEFDDYSETAMQDFIAVIENGIKGKLKQKKEANMNKWADHEGWSNYATWAVALFIDNNQEMLNIVLDDIKDMGENQITRAAVWTDLEDIITGMVEEKIPQDTGGIESLISNFISSGLNNVQWGELADHYIAKFKDNAPILEE